MALPIKDGEATLTSLKSTLSGTDHVVHRIVDEMPATAASTGTPSIPAKVLMVGAQNPSAKCVPLSVDASGFLNTNTTITGSATENKQDTIIDKLTEANVDHAANEVLLGTIAGDTTSLDSKVTECNTGAVVLAGGSANIGDVDVASVTLPTTVVHGKKTVTTAGTEVALASTATLKSGVTIKALSGNTGLIYVGINPVTSADGFELNAKESVFVEVADPATIYIDSAVNGEGVTYIGS
tara:strand:- start:46 stop:762 length:717 start_codon:yes stop_codon:yes gene_type:complete